MEKSTTPKTKKPAAAEPSGKYFEAVGRRKTATARVRIFPTKSGKEVIINGAKNKEYFKVPRLEHSAVAPLKLVKADPHVEVKAYGGGIMAQAEAVALGIGRALVKWDPSFKLTLKAAGYLTRDSRAVERKKPGLRKARRAHQWKKR